jgi:Domain of unknown function (DUF4282)
MAGQPPEPSWQPVGQDRTQARAWAPPPPPQQQTQQPSFTPQGGTPPGGVPQDAYGYPPPSGQGYPPPPAYPGPAQDQAYPGQEQQAYPGQEQQGYQGQEQTFAGQDHAQWQAVPGRPAARPGRPRGNGEKGFLGSLFDFSFSSFVTPKIIKVLYVLFTVWTALVSLLILIVSFRTGGAVAGIFVLIVIIPIYVLLTLGVYRVILEAFMVVFRIYEETKKISERSQTQV